MLVLLRAWQALAAGAAATRAWRGRAGFAAEDVLQAGDFFGICGFASIDWLSCELACQYLGAPSACRASPA